MVKHKMLRQNIESRHRVEEFKEKFENKYNISISLSQAEAMLTEIGIEQVRKNEEEI